MASFSVLPRYAFSSEVLIVLSAKKVWKNMAEAPPRIFCLGGFSAGKKCGIIGETRRKTYEILRQSRRPTAGTPPCLTAAAGPMSRLPPCRPCWPAHPGPGAVPWRLYRSARRRGTPTRRLAAGLRRQKSRCRRKRPPARRRHPRPPPLPVRTAPRRCPSR